MAKKAMGQHVIDELEVLCDVVAETKRRFNADLDALADRAGKLRGDMLLAKTERERQQAVDAAAEQAASGKPAPRSNGSRALQGRPSAEEAVARAARQPRPDTDPAPGDEPPVAWPCRHPENPDGYAVRMQDGATGAPGMRVQVRAKSGRVGYGPLADHVLTDRHGEVWTTGRIEWSD